MEKGGLRSTKLLTDIQDDRYYSGTKEASPRPVISLFSFEEMAPTSPPALLLAPGARGEGGRKGEGIFKRETLWGTLIFLIVCGL